MDILIAATFTALAITIEHLSMAHMGRLWRYALGVAAFMLPFTAVALMRQWYEPLVAVWACISAAAVTTGLWWGYDSWKMLTAREAHERDMRGQVGIVKPQD